MEKVGNVENFVLVKMHEEHWKQLEDLKKRKYNGGCICSCGNFIERNKGRKCKSCIEDYH